MSQTNGLKALALVIAIILWAYVRVTVGGVTQNPVTQLELKIPLETKGAGTNLIPFEKSADTITVTVRGESDLVNELGEGMVRAFVDLKDVAAGSAWPEVQVIVPGDITIMNIDPKSVNVRISPLMAKEVPIRVDVSGKPKPGFKAGTPLYEPKSVKIEGPEELVRQVAEVRGGVQVDGLSESFSAIAKNLVAVSETGALVVSRDVAIRFEVREVHVTVPIEQRQTLESVALGLDQVKVDEERGYRYDIELEPQFVQVSSSLGTGALPKIIQIPPVTLKPNGAEVVSKVVELPSIEGVSYVGKGQVKLTLIPYKVDNQEVNR